MEFVADGRQGDADHGYIEAIKEQHDAQSDEDSPQFRGECARAGGRGCGSCCGHPPDSTCERIKCQYI